MPKKTGDLIIKTLKQFSNKPYGVNQFIK